MLSIAAQGCSEADTIDLGLVLLVFELLAFAGVRLRQAGCSHTPNLRGDFHGDIWTESAAGWPAVEA